MIDLLSVACYKIVSSFQFVDLTYLNFIVA